MTTPREPFLDMFRRPVDGAANPAGAWPTGGRAAPRPAPPAADLAGDPPAVPRRAARSVAGAVAAPARGLTYAWSQRWADGRAARQDARRGRPDIDLGDAA